LEDSFIKPATTTATSTITSSSATASTIERMWAISNTDEKKHKKYDLVK